jgi:hypothetical protein
MQADMPLVLVPFCFHRVLEEFGRLCKDVGMNLEGLSSGMLSDGQGDGASSDTLIISCVLRLCCISKIVTHSSLPGRGP